MTPSRLTIRDLNQVGVGTLLTRGGCLVVETYVQGTGCGTEGGCAMAMEKNQEVGRTFGRAGLPGCTSGRILRAAAASFASLRGRTAATFAAALLVTLAGCGDGAIPLDRLEDEMARAICAAYDRCPLLVGRLDDEAWLLGSSTAECVANLEMLAAFWLDVLRSRGRLAVEKGTAKYDGAAARACLDAFARASCEEISKMDALVPVCPDIFQGTVPVGGSCRINEECNGGWCDAEPHEKCPGICVAWLATGEDCSGSWDRRCAPGLWCDPNLFRCTERSSAAEGESCAGEVGCAYGLTCDEGTSLCRPLKLVGEGEVCGNGALCDRGLRCFSAADKQTCKRVSVGHTEGAACWPEMYDAACDLTDGLFCDPYKSRCVLLPGAGEPCLYGEVCDPWQAFCDEATGTCREMLPSGAPCTSWRQCRSHWCNDGKCAALTEVCFSPFD